MKRLSYRQPVHLSKLHDELLAAIPALAGEREPGQPRLRVAGDATSAQLDVDDQADEATIAAIVAAHDPTPPPDKAALQRDAIRPRISELEQLADKLAAGTATAAERTRALELACRICARLARLELNQLD